jgi:leucyl aminopeptidase (aminopeptidase T)
MDWVERDRIVPGVESMLRVNLGLGPAERVLVVTDVLSPDRWREYASGELEGMLRRSYLARLVSEVAAASFPENRADFYAFEATCQPGKEPPAAAAARFKEADVLVAIVSFSLSHTAAREEACRAGVRVASMPRFIPEMFYPGGPMAVDYTAIAAETQVIAAWLTAAGNATVRSPDGTDLRFSLVGRQGLSDHGLYTAAGSWGNLPAGEAYVAPVEGSAEGRIVVRRGWFPGLEREDLILSFERGEVVQVTGGGELGRKLSAFLGFPGAAGRPRRQLAELGVGTNPNARRTDIVLEAEKIRGTVHLAIGDNSHMGGRNAADFHQDYIIPEAELVLDGVTRMKAGKLLV